MNLEKVQTTTTFLYPHTKNNISNNSLNIPVLFKIFHLSSFNTITEISLNGCGSDIRIIETCRGSLHEGKLGVSGVLICNKNDLKKCINCS